MLSFATRLIGRLATPAFPLPPATLDAPSWGRSRGDYRPDPLLEREWDELAARLQALPYLQPGWTRAWWRAFGYGELGLHTVRNDGGLTGIVPVVRRNRIFESPANYHTPVFGMLAEDQAATMELARRLFADQPTHLSFTSLEPDGISMYACTQAAAEAGYRVVIRPFLASPYLEVIGSWEAYECSLGHNMLRNLRRARRQLEREGKVSIEVVTGGEHLDERLREAFRVEGSGWKSAAGTAIQADLRCQRFYSDIGHWGAGRGILRLFMLRLEGRPLAMCLALQAHGACHLLKAGYDMAFSRHSPGNILMHAVMRECFAAGVARVELNGDSEPYKLCWARATHDYKRLEAFAPTTAGRLAWASYQYARPVTSRVRQRLGLRPQDHRQ